MSRPRHRATKDLAAAPDTETDQKLVAEFLRAVSELSQLEVARRVEGVTQGDVSRWRRGEWSWLTGQKRRAIRRFLESQQPGASEPAAPVAPFYDRTLLERLIASIAPPGKATGAKLDVLDGYRRMITAVARLPTWWYELKEMVEAGRL